MSVHLRTGRRPPVLSILSALSVVALAASACGSDDENAGAGGSGGGGGPESVAPALDTVCADGAEEGSLTFWGQLDNGPAEALFDGFHETFPDIEFQYQPLITVDIVQRVISADSVNRPPGVDIATGAIEDFLPLTSRDLQATDVDWQELGVPEDVVDPDTNLARLDRVPLGLVYNTDRVSNPDDLPNTWEELIDEKWRGQVIVDPNGQPFKTLAVAWGVDETVDYLERLKDVVEPIVVQGGTAGATAVSSGEGAMVTNGREESFRELEAKGAPVGMKFLDVVPTSNDWALVLKDAEHPNAARCFAAWVTSSDRAEEILIEQEFKSNDTRPATAPPDSEIVSVTTQEDVDRANKIGKKMVELFGGGG
ncbi:ABC transporter substrate-binding protein [Actinophytocola sp.]|uniref:ABC transporter substrate-binding protein n=1 Tax=Actinophytocola sp. TaxID=1872138 RepID=UPI003D6B2AC1